MTREEMIDKVIKTRGFEDELTIWFANLAEDETINHDYLKYAMIAILAFKNKEEKGDF